MNLGVGWAGEGGKRGYGTRLASQARGTPVTPPGTPRGLLKILAAVVVIAGAVACSSGPAASAGTPSRTPASPAAPLRFCQNVEALQAVLASLTPLKGKLPTSAQMTAAASSIETNLAGLANQHQWQTQIDNLESATQTMKSAAGDLAASPGAGGVAARARTATAQVNDAIRRLVSAVGVRCPSTSATAASGT